MRDSRKPGELIGATYSRTSNPNDTREASIESQEEAAVARLEAEGVTVPVEYRFRERFTGMESIYDRPVLGKLRDLAASGKIHAACCYDTDRLARDPNELTIVVRGFHKDGVKPLFVRLDHETTGRIGEMILYMKGFASAVEWDQIRDRSIRGRQKIYEAGDWVGHGRPRYGLLWNKAERSRTAHPDRAPVVVRIFKEIASGIEPPVMARTLIDEGVPPPHRAEWSGTTIRSIIKDPVYKGAAYARTTRPSGRRSPKGKTVSSRRPPEEWIRLDSSKLEALVSEELWARANAMLAANPTRTRLDIASSGDDFLLSCMVWCGKCSRKMTQARTKNRFTPGKRCRAYRCTGNVPNRRDRTGCSAALGAIRLENDAWRKVESLLLEPEVLEMHLAGLEAARAGASIDSDLKAAEKRRKAIAREVKRTADALARSSSRIVVKTLEEKIAELDGQAILIDQQIELLRSRMANAECSLGAIASFRTKIQSLRDLVRAGDLTYELKREILVSLGVRVIGWAGGCRVEIEVDDAVRHHYRSSNPGTTRSVVVDAGVIRLA